MTTEAFWAYSLDFYARPGVAAACLRLQDDHGADVDVVLFALWCARRGCCLARAELDAIDRAVASWRARVVQPIRLARRALRPAPGPPFDPAAAAALHEHLQAAELEAERLQQGAMEALAPAPGTADPVRAAQDNVALVAAQAGIPADSPHLVALIRAFA